MGTKYHHTGPCERKAEEIQHRSKKVTVEGENGVMWPQTKDY